MFASTVHYLTFSRLGNKLLQDHKLDNRLFAEEPERCAAVIGIALNHLALLSGILAPYMPATAASIAAQLGLAAPAAVPDVFAFATLAPGHRIGEAKLLFTAIKAEKVEEWREAFGGEEQRRLKAEAARKAAEKKAARDKDKERKKAKKAAGKVSAEGAEKQQEADPAIEAVTEALQNADVRMS